MFQKILDMAIIKEKAAHIKGVFVQVDRVVVESISLNVGGEDFIG